MSFWIFLILSSLLCIILIALSLANWAFFNLVESPESLASVIKALVSSTNFCILSFWAITSAILFDKRRVKIGTSFFLPFFKYINSYVSNLLIYFEY
jgi:hypothetical protein